MFRNIPQNVFESFMEPANLPLKETDKGDAITRKCMYVYNDIKN